MENCRDSHFQGTGGDLWWVTLDVELWRRGEKKGVEPAWLTAPSSHSLLTKSSSVTLGVAKTWPKKGCVTAGWFWGCYQEVWGGISLMLSPTPQCTGLCMGFPGTELWLRVWQGTGPPPPPSQATAHRTPPRSSCFPSKSIQGHPVLWVSSCGGGSHIGQSGACSQLPTLNMGGHGSPWQALPCYLEVAPIVCPFSFAAWKAFLLLPLSADLCVFNGLEKPHMGGNLLNLLLWYRGTSLMRNTSL